MSKLKVQVVYSGEKILSITDTFEAIVDKILNDENFMHYDPLKIKFPGVKKMLYFDKALFHEFHRGELKYTDLLERTYCDELYRNWLEIEAAGEIIEPGALWKLEGNELTLIDAERHITYIFNAEAFEIAI